MSVRIKWQVFLCQINNTYYLYLVDVFVYSWLICSQAAGLRPPLTTRRHGPQFPYKWTAGWEAGLITILFFTEKLMENLKINFTHKISKNCKPGFEPTTLWWRGGRSNHYATLSLPRLFKISIYRLVILGIWP